MCGMGYQLFISIRPDPSPLTTISRVFERIRTSCGAGAGTAMKLIPISSLRCWNPSHTPCVEAGYRSRTQRRCFRARRTKYPSEFYKVLIFQRFCARKATFKYPKRLLKPSVKHPKTAPAPCLIRTARPLRWQDRMVDPGTFK